MPLRDSIALGIKNPALFSIMNRDRVGFNTFPLGGSNFFFWSIY